MASVYPDNWLEPEFPRLSQLVDLARDGYPVTWVPSGAVITALAQADPSQRRVVLLAQREQILDDCATVVAEIDDDDLEELTEKLTEAITTAAAGHDAAAQALTTNIMDTGLRIFFPPASPQGYFKYLHVANKIKDVDPDACVMRELPRACVMWPVVPALQPFFGGMSKAEFNRHNTAHAVTAVQYSEPIENSSNPCGRTGMSWIARRLTSEPAIGPSLVSSGLTRGRHRLMLSSEACGTELPTRKSRAMAAATPPGPQNLLVRFIGRRWTNGAARSLLDEPLPDRLAVSLAYPWRALLAGSR